MTASDSIFYYTTQNIIYGYTCIKDLLQNIKEFKNNIPKTNKSLCNDFKTKKGQLGNGGNIGTNVGIP